MRKYRAYFSFRLALLVGVLLIEILLVHIMGRESAYGACYSELWYPTKIYTCQSNGVCGLDGTGEGRDCTGSGGNGCGTVSVWWSERIHCKNTAGNWVDPGQVCNVNNDDPVGYVQDANWVNHSCYYNPTSPTPTPSGNPPPSSGPPPSPVNDPKGAMDAVTCSPAGVIGVAGWTGDNDVPTQQLMMHLYVDDPTANVASNKMGEVLGDKFITYQSALAVCNAITNNNSSVCSPCGATNNSGSNLGQCNHRTNTSTVNTSFPGRALLDDGAVHDVYARVNNAGSTGSGYKIIGPKPVQCTSTLQQNCTVTVNKTNLIDPSDNSVQITVQANGASGTATIDAYIAKWPDAYDPIGGCDAPSALFSGTTVNSPSQYPQIGSGVCYYKIPAFNMTSVNGSVQSSTATLNILEPGDYAISCNVINSSTSTYCSGNPYCTYSGAGGSEDCTGFNDCNPTDDFKLLSVDGTISGNIYYDPNASCSTSQGFTDTFTVSVGGVAANITGSSYSRVVDPGSYTVQLSGYDTNQYQCSACGTTCPTKTGIVPTASNVNFFLTDVTEAWWRAVGGDVYTGATTGIVTIQSIIPIGSQYWLNNDGSGTSPFAMRRSGSMYFGSLVNADTPSSGRQRAVSTYQGDVYDFDFWKANLGLPLIPTADVTNNTLTRSDLTPGKAYYYVRPFSGSTVTLSSDGSWVNIPATPTKYVIFVEGNLVINSQVSVNTNGFLMFIVSGTVTIGSGADNVESIVVSDGSVTISPDNQQLQYEGSIITWGSLNFGRDLGTGNDTTPAELFTYRPDFLRVMPDNVKVFDLEWQEVAPGSF